MQVDEVDPSDGTSAAISASSPERAAATAGMASGPPPFPEHAASHVLEGPFTCVLHHGTKYSSHSQRYYVTLDLSGAMRFFRQRKESNQTVPSSLANADATETLHIHGARVIDRGTRRRKPCFSLALPPEDEPLGEEGLASGKTADPLVAPSGADGAACCRVSPTNSNAHCISSAAPEEEKYVLVNHADLLFVQREVFFYTTDKMLKWKWICALQHLCGTCQGLYGPCEMFHPRERVASVKAAPDASGEPLSPHSTTLQQQNGVRSESNADPAAVPSNFPDSQDSDAASVPEPSSPKLSQGPTGMSASPPEEAEVESLEAVLQRYAAKQKEQEERKLANESGTSGSNGVADACSPECGMNDSPLTSSFAAKQRYQSSFAGGGDGNVSAAAQARMERSPLYAACLADELCNQECADCGERYPTWCVLQPFGVFVCIDCCGVHRSLWPSKCREIELDHWTPENIEFMASRGNALMNKELEYHCCRRVQDTTSSTNPVPTITTTMVPGNDDTQPIPPRNAHPQLKSGGTTNDDDDDDSHAGVVPVYKPYGRHSSHAVRQAYISAKYHGEFSRQRNIPIGEPFYYPVYDPVGVHRGRRSGRNYSSSGPAAGAGAQPTQRNILSFNPSDGPTATEGPPRYIGVVDIQLKEAEGVRSNGTSNLIAVLANGFQEIRTRPGRVSGPTALAEDSEGASWLPAKQARKLLRLGLAATRGGIKSANAVRGRDASPQQQQQQQQVAAKPKLKKLRGPLPQVRILPPASALGSVTWDEVLHIGIDHISRPLYVTVYDSSDNVLATAVIVLSELQPQVSEEPHLMTVPLRCQRIGEDLNNVEEERAVDASRKDSASPDDIVEDEDDASPAAATAAASASAPVEDTHSVAVCGTYYHHTRAHKSTIVSAVPLLATLLGPTGPTVEIETAPPLLYFVVSFQVMG